MTILHLIETTGPGGAETVLVGIVKHLPADSFSSVAIVTGPGWVYDNLAATGIPVVMVPLRNRSNILFLHQVRRIIREYDVHLIHSHLDGMNFFACLAGWCCRKPVVATFHGIVGDWNPKNARTRLKFAVIRHRACRVVAVSEFLRNELIGRWGFAGERVVRIYNGVDFAAVDSMSDTGDIRKEYGIPNSAPVVAMIGNIRKPKGYEYLVRAARVVVDRTPSCRFLIVGEGKGRLLSELKALIADLNLADRVILTGFRSDVPQILQQIDIFALSSVTEGLSIATIEAMAVGRPVVVTASGGPEEIVEDGVTGFLVPPADHESLAAKILHVLDNPQLAAQMGERARENAKSRFGIDRNLEEHIKVYRSCLPAESE